MGWWYVRRVTGEDMGPMTEFGVEAELDAGRLMPDGWVCVAGGSQWVRVDNEPIFANAVDRATRALEAAPTAYVQSEVEQRQLSDLYESRVEEATQSQAQTVVRRQQSDRALPFPLAVSGPASSALPIIPTNPLSEPFGPAGWAAILFTALAPVPYLIAAAILLATAGSLWLILPALVSTVLFTMATVQLVRRRRVGYLLSFGGHATWLGLLAVTMLIGLSTVGMSAGTLIAVVLMTAHLVVMGLLHWTKSLFWIQG